MKSLCLVCFVALAAQGQNIFITPGANSTSGAVSVVSSSTLAPAGTFSAGPGAFQVLSVPSGTKYYVLSNTGSATVTVVDSAFANPRSLGNFGSQATAAAITPNGSRVLVAAGTLHVIDANTDFDLFPNGLNVGSNLFDVAISLDGSRAFLLGRNPAGGSTVFALDTASNNILGSIAVPGSATGVAVGPNGFVYVSTLNQVLEINPNPFAVTPSGTIALNANPSKLVFTPDGKFALAANQTPITGSSVILLDLNAHNVFNTLPNFNTILDRLFVAGNNLVFAYSSQTSSLYQISIIPLAINALSVPGVNGAVTAAALSNEVAGGARANSQYLYFVIGSTLYRYDIASGLSTGQLALSAAAGGISVPVVPNTAGAPTTILQYGNNQTVAAGSVTNPLVVRVLDPQGLPIRGVTVSFSTPSTAIIQNPTVVTGSDGFALTNVTAPGTNGQFIITATLPGGQAATFTLAAGSGGTTGGGSSSQITIVAGQGQVVFENFNTATAGFGSPLTVLVRDITGNPVANSVVTFAIVSGPGALLAAGVQGAANGATITVNTDVNGLASAAFLSSAVNPGSGYQQTAISVNAPGTNTVNFFITTTTQNPQGLFVVFNKPQSGDPALVGQAGTVLKGAVNASVTSIRGPVANVSLRAVTLNASDPTMGPFVSCADPTGTGVLTDMTGTATCDLLFGPKIGTGQFQVNVGYFIQTTASFTFTTTPGPPSAIKIVQGNNQTGASGQTLPSAFLFQVTDAGANALAGVPVTFTISPPGALTLTNLSNATDGNGNASALAKLGNIAGPATVKVTAGSASATFTVNVSIPVIGIQAVSGGGQTGLVNATFGAPLVVRLTNANGAGVGGSQVSFAVGGGSATLGSPTAVTDANGNASTTVTAGPNAGPITITASANGFNTSFSLTSRLPGPTNVIFLNGASFQQGIAPGAIVTINGTGILPGIQGLVTANSIIGPLPLSLSGVQIQFNGIAAPIYSLSNSNGVESVTVQVPFELPVGPATVTITAAGGGTATISNVPVSQYSPGVFESLFSGQKQAVAIRPDGSYVSPTNPALRGEVDCIFATGLGQVSPATATNSSGVLGQNVVATLDVGVNNGGVRLVSATYLPGVVGVYMVCLQIPVDAAPGPSQPIGLDVHDSFGATIFSQSTFIPIL